MLGHNPAEAKAAKLQSELKAKAASRKYEAYCQSSGMSPLEARLLEPRAAEKGRLLRAAEERKRRLNELHAKKEKIDQNFS